MEEEEGGRWSFCACPPQWHPSHPSPPRAPLYLQRTYRGGDTATTEKSVVVGVVSRIDLLKYITSHELAQSPMPGTSSAHSFASK